MKQKPIFDLLGPKMEACPNGSMMMAKLLNLQPFMYFGTYGSKLYGTAVAESDDDYRGVYLPRPRDLIMSSAREGDVISSRSTERKSGPGDFDTEFYTLKKYLDLLDEGQTTALDMLFTPETHVVQASMLWRTLQQNKSKLINKKCRAAIDYARSQANRYSVRGDRIAAVKTVMEIFDIDACNFPNRRLRESIDRLKFRDWLSAHPEVHEHVRMTSKANEKTGKVFEYLEVCGKSADLNATVEAAYKMFKNKLDEYGYRARQAYDAGGADWKALYHAVRVGAEMTELLLTGNITFPRPEAAYLLDVRGGRLPLPAVYERIDEVLAEVEAAQRVSTLPETSDRLMMDDLIVSHYGDEMVKWLGAEGYT